MIACDTPYVTSQALGVRIHLRSALYRTSPRCNQASRKRCRGKVSPTWLWTVRMRGERCETAAPAHEYESGGEVYFVWFCDEIGRCRLPGITSEVCP